jgi:hypothetical protein
MASSHLLDVEIVIAQTPHESAAAGDAERVQPLLALTVGSGNDAHWTF